VRFTESRKVTLSLVRTRKNGFAAISPFDHLGELMAMADRLTTTIEDAGDMYCRHISSKRGMVKIWHKDQIFDFMQKNYLPYVEARLAKSKVVESGKKFPALRAESALSEFINQ
jgi:hypothetical protein